MSTRVNLFFREFYSEEMEKCISGYKLIRLLGRITLKTSTGFTTPRRAIIDTGAHISVLPLSIWRLLDLEIIGSSKLRGIIPKEECEVDVSVGIVKCLLLDEEGNQTNEMKVHSLLALTDAVPILIGFKDLLDRFMLHSNYPNEAWVKERGENDE